MESPGRYANNEVKDRSTWIELRAAQSRLSTVPNVDVIATYDLGQPEQDVHALTSMRAARWAAALIGNTTKTGPVYQSHSIEGATVTIAWKTGADLASDGRLKGFEVAGADGEWHAAAATIKEKSVLVTSEAVSNPKAVRYAWSWAPRQANLRNAAGFAALPFAAK